MSPSAVLSSHLAKQFATSWREIRQPSELGQTSPGANAATNNSYFQRASSPASSDDGKQSMDNDRSSSSPLNPATSRPSSSTGWRWGSR